MLKSLSIKNVALIREAEIDFSNGLNVLSGETGAGKSVVLEALNFALGQKADKSMICHGENVCSVSCVFDVTSNECVKEALDELAVDYDDEIVIKRTLNMDGKSTIKLNGENFTATMLRKVTSLLVDVHGQSDHFVLLKEANQLALLDGLGGDKIDQIKQDATKIIAEIKSIDEDLDGLGGDESSRARRIDYLQFAIDEIEKVDFLQGEEESLSDKKKKLLNLEKISLACSEAYDILSSEGGVTDLLSSAARKLSSISQYGKEYSDLSFRIENCLDELTDIAELVNDGTPDEFDQNAVDEIENRLNAISNIKRKYGKTYEDVQNSLQSFKRELDLISDSETKIAKLTKERALLIEKLESVYLRLSDERKAIAGDLSVRLSDKLKELAMKGADFKVEFSKLDGEVLSKKGRDEVTFTFTANKGEPLKPLSKIISGGELSRLMLAVKAVAGGGFGTQTYVFDEIDVGISGEAAEVVARNFAKIAANRQIVAISHLPQIVAMADVSFMIKKGEEADRTVTRVTKLIGEEKTKEVVRLVGGTYQSQAAVAHAKEMISKADQFKKSI